jgi:hypothetical protein
MRIRGLAVLALTVLMLGLVFYPQAAAEKTRAPDADEATAIKMHFKGEGLTTVAPAAGNSTEETKTCSGRSYGGRRYGTPIGDWTFLPAGTFRVQGSFKAELWAKSDAGAKNAGFRLNFYEGDNLITQNGLFSDRTDVSSPHKFTISGSLSANCAAGTTVKVNLVWLSEPNYGVGPSSGGTFIYGSKDHDSLIEMTLTASPVTMNVTSADKEGNNIKVNARVNESLGMPIDSITYNLAIQGPASVSADHIAKPTVSAGDNGTSVSWLWNYRQSKAQTGLYTFTITVAYSNESIFSNATQIMIKIESPTVVDSLTQLTGGSNFLLIIIIVVVVAVVVSVVTFFVIRKQRVKKAKLRAEPESAAAV